MKKWVIDSDHSVAAFAIRHMMIAHVHGQFNKINGVIQFAPENISHLKVELEIDVTSMLTGIKKRDDHLKSKDFFNKKKYPKITFKSSKVEKTGFNICTIKGKLSIHGITHLVTVESEFFGPVRSPFGETSIGFTGKIKINREDFGMKWNVPMENGGVMVGKEVRIFLDLEADLSPD